MTDEEIARRLSEACDLCNDKPSTPGHNYCSDCYHTVILRRHRCTGCNNFVVNPHICGTCSQNIPEEEVKLLLKDK